MNSVRLLNMLNDSCFIYSQFFAKDHLLSKGNSRKIKDFSLKLEFSVLVVLEIQTFQYQYHFNNSRQESSLNGAKATIAERSYVAHFIPCKPKDNQRCH